ncbi:Protein roadkill, partial [Stegodyphus mimosarum]
MDSEEVDKDLQDVSCFSKCGVLTRKDVFRWNVHSSIIINDKKNARSDFFTFGPVPNAKFCLLLSSDPDKMNFVQQFGVCLCRIPTDEDKIKNEEDITIKVSFSLLDTRDRLHHTCERTMKECSRVYAAFERSIFDKHQLIFLRKGNLTIHCAMDVEEIVSETNQSPKGNVTQPSIKELIQETDGIGDLTRDFKNLLDNQKFTDVTLSVHGTDFQAHRAILGARSPVFAAMFEHDTVEKIQNRIVIEDFSSEVISLLLRYLYTDETSELTSQTCLALFVAADKYAVPKLKRICSKFLCSNLTTDMALGVLTVANLHEDEALKEAAVQLILDNAVKVMKSDEWLSFLKDYPELANNIILNLAMKSLKS